VIRRSWNSIKRAGRYSALYFSWVNHATSAIWI